MFRRTASRQFCFEYLIYLVGAFLFLSLIVVSETFGRMPAVRDNEFFVCDPENIVLEICWNDVSADKRTKYTEIILTSLIEKGYNITKGEYSNCGFKEFYEDIEDPINYMKNRVNSKKYSSDQFDAYMLFEASTKDDFIRFWLLDIKNGKCILQGKKHCWLTPCEITTYTTLDRHKTLVRTYKPHKPKNNPEEKIDILLAQFPIAKSKRIDFYSRKYKIDSVKRYNKIRQYSYSIEIWLACLGFPAPEYSHQMTKREKQYRKLWNKYRFSGKRFLKEELKGKHVFVKCYHYEYDNKFHNNIIQGEVFLDDKNINLEMLKSGLVVLDKRKVPEGIDLRPYIDAQREAKTNNNGIWAIDHIKKINLDKLCD